MFRWSLALILLAAVTVSRAQKVDDLDYKLGVNVELVQLPVSVLDKTVFRFAAFSGNISLSTKTKCFRTYRSLNRKISR